MIGGCTDWPENGFIRPEIVAEATKSYFDEQDMIGQWIEDECDEGSHVWETSGRLFKSWEIYQENNGEKSGTSKTFSQNLVKRGFQADRQYIGNKTQRIFKGLALKFDPGASGIIHD